MMSANNRGTGVCRTLLLVACLLAPAVAEASSVEEVKGWAGQSLNWLQHAHPAQLVAVLIVAPLFALPISALLVVVGIALPFPIALAVTIFALWVHHLLMFALSRTRTSQWLQGELCKRNVLPSERSEQSLFNDFLFLLTAAWLPGLSYIFKVGLVALAGLPARTYFVLGILGQLTAAIPYLLLGEVAKDVGFGRITLCVFAVLGAVWGVRYFVSRRRRAERLSVPEKQSS